MVALRAAGPAMWAELAQLAPSLAVVSEAHAAFTRSAVGTFILTCFSMLYCLTASGAIFCFWKTSMRVPTIATTEGVGFHGKDSWRRHGAVGGSRQCGLC